MQVSSHFKTSIVKLTIQQLIQIKVNEATKISIYMKDEGLKVPTSVCFHR